MNSLIRNKLFIYKILTGLVAVWMIVAGCFTVHGADVSGDIVLTVGSPYMETEGQLYEIDKGRDTAPIISGGRTLVPIRAVVEAMGGKVDWIGDSSTAVLVYGDTEVRLRPDDAVAYVNNVAYTLDTPPTIVNSRTMIPVRFVAERFGFVVEWLPEGSKIIIKPNVESVGFAVHYIDVGQGDSIFVQLPDGKNMLIDAGPGENIVNIYLKKLGVGALDYVVATHPDADHIGGMPQILEEFVVGELFMPDKVHTTQLFERMLDSIDANGCRVAEAKAGVDLTHGVNYNIKFLAPCKTYDDNNNSSAVVMLEYDGKKFLFTGDIEAQGEADILASGADIDADVLKVAHHGSSTSTTDAFLDAVTPEVAVISVGADNKYGHPDEETIQKLNVRGTKYYLTSESGTVILSVSSGEIMAESDKGIVAHEGETVQSAETSIYRTKTGDKYHIEGCSSLRSKILISYKEAVELGLEPCSKCNPPMGE